MAVICAFQFFLFVYRISLLSCILGIINCSDRDLWLRAFESYVFIKAFLEILIQKLFSGYADRKGHANFRGKAYQFSVLIPHYQNGASILCAVIMVMQNLGLGGSRN